MRQASRLPGSRDGRPTNLFPRKGPPPTINQYFSWTGRTPAAANCTVALTTDRPARSGPPALGRPPDVLGPPRRGRGVSVASILREMGLSHLEIVFLLVAAIAVAAWVLWRRWKPKSITNQCPNCRYDRAGIDPAVPCPECGAI